MAEIHADQVKKVIEQLQQQAQIELSKNNFTAGSNLGQKANDLQMWLEGGMKGECPIPDFDQYLGDGKDQSVSGGGETRVDEVIPLPKRPGTAPVEGIVLRGGKASYRLVKGLGQGKYAFTWLAEVVEGEIAQTVMKTDELGFTRQMSEPIKRVAIKIANPGLLAEEQRNFDQEVETLRSLHIYAFQQKLLQDGYALTPTVFDTVDAARAAPYPPFFVITLASGVPVDELWREKGALPERDALCIVEQFCKVLESLHMGVRRSYLDFQPKNIFWDAETRRIMVIDWNLLSKFENMNRAQDLLQAVKLLYNLLMGVPAPEPGSRRALAQPETNWKKVSVGAQAILTKGLAPTERYGSAEELRADVEDLLKLWIKKEDDLLREINTLIGDVPRTGKLNSVEATKVEKAARALSVLERTSLTDMGKMDVEMLRRAYAAWLEGRGSLENGKNHFRAFGYEDARKNFQLAVDEAWNKKTELEAHRWLTAIAAFQEQTATERLEGESVKAAMDWIEGGQYSLAQGEFERLARQPGRGALQYLAYEAQIWILLQDMNSAEQRRDYSNAATMCRKALELIRKFPGEFSGYQSSLAGHTGNLEQRSEELEEKAVEYSQVKDIVTAAEQALQQDFPQALALLRNAFDERPGQNDLVNLCVEQVHRLLDDGEYPQARALAALASDYAAGRVEMAEVWKAASLMADAWNGWLWADPARISEALTGLLALSRGKELALRLLERAMTSAQTARNFYKADFLLRVYEGLVPEAAHEQRGKVELLRREENQRIRAAFADGSETGTGLLAGLLMRYPTQPDLIGWTGDVLRDCLKKRDYLHAKRLTSLVPDEVESLASMRTLVDRLMEAEQAWKTEGVNGLKEVLLGLPEGNEPTAGVAALVSHCFEQATEKGDYFTARKIFDLMPLAALTERDVLTEKLHQLGDTIVDEWMKKIEQDVPAAMTMINNSVENHTDKAAMLELVDQLMGRYLTAGKYEQANQIAHLPVFDVQMTQMTEWTRIIYKANNRFVEGAGVDELKQILGKIA